MNKSTIPTTHSIMQSNLKLCNQLEAKAWLLPAASCCVVSCWSVQFVVFSMRYAVGSEQ